MGQSNNEYKSLYIDREKIISTIKDYLEKKDKEYYIDENFETFNNNQNRIHIKCNNMEFYIDFYFKKDDTTTISIIGGENTSFKKDIAEYIKQSEICCLVQNDAFKNSWYVVENIDLNTTELIINTINDCFDEKVLISSEKDDDSFGPIWKLCGKYKEKVVIHHYTNKRKTMLQGKPRLLFSMLTSAFNELVDHNSFVSNFNDYFKINIDKGDIEKQYDNYLPNIDNNMSEKLKNTYLQAIYNLNMDGDMYEYNYLAYPIFRGLEGHLRYIFKEHNINANKCIGSEFCYNEEEKIHYLKPMHHEKFENSDIIIKYVEEVYNKLNNERNMMFHWDVPNGIMDTTSVCYDIDKAKTQIVECLSLINDYYRLK